MILLALQAVACADDAAEPPAAPLPPPVSTEHCAYEPMAPTARSGATVTAGPVSAGVAEAAFDVPVGTVFCGFGQRAAVLSDVPFPDQRELGRGEGRFIPSVGVETMPMAHALALSAGDETIVLLNADIALASDHVTADVEQALGPELAGKILFTVSHSHSSWGQLYHGAPQVACGSFSHTVHERIVAGLVQAAEAALADRRAAKIGIAHDSNFDPEHRISFDRRPENDMLPDGKDRKDRDLYVIRVDDADDQPLAILPVLGVHPHIMSAHNQMASTDLSGALSRELEEQFDHPVMVFHLQAAGGDVDPALKTWDYFDPGVLEPEQPEGGIRCHEDQPCEGFSLVEVVARRARGPVLAAWEAAGQAMRDEVALEMVTRSIELGPDWRNFLVRDGGLEYAPFVEEREPDNVIYGDDGAILSPIDEFNAPYGAGLCTVGTPLIPGIGIPGAQGPYGACVRVEKALPFIVDLFGVPEETMPACQSTRTTISALRMDDWVIAALPGEPETLFADAVRAASPVEPDRTIVLGYAQDHIGYLMTAEDWLQGGYQPSNGAWGPLEGERILERSVEVMALAVTDEREDATADGADRWMPATEHQRYPDPDSTPHAGTVPETVPSRLYVPGEISLGSPQPPASVARLSTAHFVWQGEDPLAGTPRVTLQRETAPGSNAFEPVTRRSGRAVQDGDLLLAWTPLPLAASDEPREHYWVVLWQAVTPMGAAGLAELEDRPGLPLGRYRFHVEGTGYALDSEPFEVVLASLTVSAELSGTLVNASASYHAPDGWRLLSLRDMSNDPVFLRAGVVTVVLELADASTRSFHDVPVAEDGTISVDAAGDAAELVRVEIRDRFGNVGGVDL